ncbi:MAG: PaaI family thioesterase [Rhodospirillaceae bacterium]|nr:PaaI family thioesterase [Rhodospirillales bacterium]
MALLTTDALTEMLAKVPLAVHLNIRVDHIRKGAVRMIMPYGPHLARPVDTVSGPAMMTLADVALWGAVLSMAGAQEMVVTTNLNMNFLRMPGSSDMVAEARVLKMGRRLAVAAVELISLPSDELVAHATASYAIPKS